MIWIWHSGLACIGLGWTYALIRTIRGSKRPYRLGPDSPDTVENASASIVIPARNEAHNIEACLNSCVAQDLDEFNVIVLNDASTDGTGEIVDRLSAVYSQITALQGDGSPLPEGWFGKPWACQRAQEHANGEWLLFIDADVVIAKEALSRAISYAQRNGLDMVTGIGEMVMLTFWERTLQPAVGGMILAGNSLRKVNDPTQKDKNLANGQFILISREAYDAIGCHGAVKNNIIDDIGIARALVDKGFQYHCLDLHELFKCRMYTCFSEIWEGWTKNLFAGLRYSWLNVFIAILFTLSFSTAGPVLLICWGLGLVGPAFGYWGLFITLAAQSVRLIIDIRRGHRVLYGLTHAPANIMVCGMIFHSALRSMRGTVTWKGRTYSPSD